MAITLVGQGTVAGGSTPLTPAYPSGVASGRVAVLKVAGKPDTNTINTPTGFDPFPNTNGTGGTGAVGVDTGPTRAAMFYRVLDGSETGTVSVSTSAGGSNNSVIDIYAADSGFDTASFAGTTGGDASHDTSWSAAGSTDLDLTSGDVLVGCSSCCSNNANNIVISSRAVSATGSTFGSVANERTFNNNTGNDSCFDTFDFPVTGGPSSAAPTYTCTHSASNSGVTSFARLVENAGGTNTTVNPAAVGATVGIPQPGASVSAGPAAVGATAGAPQPGASTSAGPAAVAATAGVPQPSASVTVGPTPVGALAGVPTPTAGQLGSGLDPATVSVSPLEARTRVSDLEERTSVTPLQARTTVSDLEGP